jgi:hypothetical protein
MIYVVGGTLAEAQDFVRGHCGPEERFVIDTPEALRGSDAPYVVTTGTFIARRDVQPFYEIFTGSELGADSCVRHTPSPRQAVIELRRRLRETDAVQRIAPTCAAQRGVIRSRRIWTWEVTRDSASQS